METGVNVMSDPYEKERRALVENFIKKSTTRKVILDAFLKVPRHRFIPMAYRSEAYEDRPLIIGRGQTISQPSLVALMTDLLRPQKKDVVLEIGTGSGYQAAILSLLVKYVYTVERITYLAQVARRRLFKLGFNNIKVIVANGTLGYSRAAPFDKIIVTAVSRQIPQTLVEQLKEGGIIVIPVGEDTGTQKLTIGVKKKEVFTTEVVEDVRFVPLVGGKTE